MIDHVAVGKLARIETITRDIVLTAAKFEATVKDALGTTIPQDNRRRKWDCFHLATAITTGCHTFYALDQHFTARKTQLGLTSLDVREPSPVKPVLPGVSWGDKT